MPEYVVLQSNYQAPSDEERVFEIVLRTLYEQEGCTRSQLHQKIANHGSKEELDQALAILEDLEVLAWGVIRRDGPGRKTTMYWIPSEFKLPLKA